MKRLLSNAGVVEGYKIDKDAVLGDRKEQDQLMLRLFPKQVEQGPQKPSTFNWMVSRCADATKKTAPRELIHLLNCIRTEEARRLENAGEQAPDDQLFDRSVFKLALPEVSQYRLNQNLYAEHSNLRPYISKLDGEKCEHTDESLGKIWNVKASEAFRIAESLINIGFFEKKGTREAPTFWVPFIYRDTLNLVQGRAEDE